MFRKKGVDDLCMAADRSNGGLTDELQSRLKAEIIYTNIGDVLVSVNPFKQLPLYGPEQVALYGSSAAYDTPPHVFHVADDAYRRMVNEGSSQACIISGESGAGKTEAAKLILNYISAVSGATGGATQHVKDCIRETNPLLESFGNAKTVRNDNSSRFGKYLEIFFNDRGEPSGGQTVKFLLEKTRVAFQAKGERSFHIFYQLVAGATSAMKEAFGFTGGTEQFYYLSQSGVSTVSGVDDKKEFELVQAAMTTIGINDTEQYAIWQILGGILHLGNIQFVGTEKATISTPENLQWASYLLELEQPQLSRLMLNRLITSGRGSAYEVPQNADQAAGMRDAVAKSLYERVFSWLVDKINFAMTPRGGAASSGPSTVRGAPPGPPGRAGAAAAGVPPPPKRAAIPPPPGGRGTPAGRAPPPGGRGPAAPESKVPSSAGALSTPSGGRTIGVLDIYGFEIFEKNGYEQFCINYVNERLQQIFIDLTLRTEQQEYHDEEMKWEDIAFFDNKVVVELIEGQTPPGIFRLLDDVCRSVHAETSQVIDQKFMAKLIKEPIAKHAHLILIPEVTTSFTIQHYAGKVTYTVEDFCFKNKDNLFSSLVMGLQGTTNGFIKGLYPENLSDNKSAPSTSGADIRNSANMLIRKLSNCSPHYIRCIKSNETRSPLGFDYNRVKHQVKYLGLLENVKVKRSGFSYRHFFANFVRRFGVLGEAAPITDQSRAGCEAIVKAVCNLNKFLKADEFVCGKTKIFVRSPETIFEMDEMIFKKTDPEGYALKVQEFKKQEKIMKKHQAKVDGLRPKCIVM